MASSSDSPEVVFREKAAPTPTFEGVHIPAALKGLRATGNQKRPSKPSDMTALANKLRSFHIDSPPDSSDFVKAASAKRMEIIESQRHKDLGDKENFFSEPRNEKYILKGINLFHSPTSASDDDGKQPRSDKKFDISRRVSELRIQEDSSSTDLLPTPEDASNKPFLTRQDSGNTPSKADSTEANNSKLGEPPGSERRDGISEGEQKRNIVEKAEQGVFERSNFEADLQKILEGKEKWTWPHRKDALLSLSKAVTTHPTEADQLLAECVSKFSTTLNDHLEELRPTVITSALSLIDAIVLKRIPMASPFSKEVFPSVMDVACGRSLTAESAARTLVHMLSFDETLAINLRDADNSERLMQLVNQMIESGDKDLSDSSSIAMKYLRKEFPNCVTTPVRPVSVPIGTPPGSSASKGEISETIASFRHGKLSARSTPNLGRRLASLRAKNFKTPSKVQMESNEQISSLRRSNANSSSKHCEMLPLDARTGTQVLKNMKLGDSVRKISPQLGRSGRLYSEEEVETIRRNAVRAAVEKVKASNAKEVQKRAREVDDMRQKLQREHAEVEDLRAVLEEFELTMKKMVSEGNSKANAQQIVLEKEKNKLKAELLERSDAFEKLKERYENSKEAIVVYENKETRFIEQIKELKRNMVELQKWSNDLKANSEKKLSKAFESVTAYRSSYIDKEAHANKALSDLKRTTAELEKAQQSHAETAAKFAAIETQLHEEQDARASAEAALATAKSSLTRVTSQKDQLQNDVIKAEEELNRLRTEAAELKEKGLRLSDAEKRLETFTSERQSLKARAYDDMMRIRDLEDQLDAKNKECDELNQICEEVMQQLEHSKTGEK